MKDLIAALTILSKYTDSNYPTHCEHDELLVPVVNPTDVSPEDIVELERLGFSPNGSIGGFRSYRFGSC